MFLNVFYWGWFYKEFFLIDLEELLFFLFRYHFIVYFDYYHFHIYDSLCFYFRHHLGIIIPFFLISLEKSVSVTMWIFQTRHFLLIEWSKFHLIFFQRKVPIMSSLRKFYHLLLDNMFAKKILKLLTDFVLEFFLSK